MKNHRLELFRLKIHKRVKKIEVSSLLNEDQRLAKVHEFYEIHSTPLIALIEKTLSRHPVVTCIFLIHQIDNIVNHHFGLREDEFTFEHINRKLRPDLS